MQFLGSITGRGRLVLSGVITVTVLSAAVYIGVRASSGAFDDTYELVATFNAAGQGLISESDVKIHGVNIGTVQSVELVDGRAEVRLQIDEGEKVPAASTATIRPKTLFGEKFVDIDPGDAETSGPFLADGERISDTIGAFELERILADLYPVLQAVDGDQLAIILTELTESGRNLGPTINRAIANFTPIADVQARHSADMQQFLDDLALLSDELARRSDDLVAGATDLNEALPPLNQRGDELATVLDEAARLSGDLADVLEANRPFMEKGITQGGKALQELYDQRGQIPGLVRGLRYFLQVLGEVGRIELGDGTRLAAVKGILGGGPVCGRTTTGCPENNPPVAPSAAPPAPLPPPPPPATTPTMPPSGGTTTTTTLVPLPLQAPQSGSAGLIGLIGAMLR